MFILSTSGFFHSFIYFRWRKGQEVEHIFVDLKNILEKAIKSRAANIQTNKSMLMSNLSLIIAKAVYLMLYWFYKNVIS